MKRIKVRDIPLSASKWRELRALANNDLHRLNMLSADCYAFSVDKAGMRHLDGTISKGNDFSGGWDSVRDICDKRAEYVYMLRTVGGHVAGKVYAINA